jgi:hypothetical protein
MKMNTINFEEAVLECIDEGRTGMNKTRNGSLIRPLPGDNNFFPLVDTKYEIFTLARINGWKNVVYMGQGGMITKPTEFKKGKRLSSEPISRRNTR